MDKESKLIRLGTFILEMMNNKLIGIENDGTEDGHCYFEGAFGSYFNDFVIDYIAKRGFK